ncbi:GATA zinc finger domain-containing protein [Mycena kentingensis (nom. inval.)]|nr:GATA zinc finger domain-containing protein [Mycena kentingensis (nom. inval.)]
MSGPTTGNSGGYSGGGSSTAQLIPHDNAYSQSYGTGSHGTVDPALLYSQGQTQYPSTAYGGGGHSQYPGYDNSYFGQQHAHTQGGSYPAGYPMQGSAANYAQGYAPDAYAYAGGSAYENQSYSAGIPVRTCARCGATSTPLWRREPGTQRTLCNACGLYAQQRHQDRPQELIDADADDSPAPVGGPSCSHCGATRTSVWRRNKVGDLVCNACGCYERLNGKPRPLELRTNRVKPRAKQS